MILTHPAIPVYLNTENSESRPGFGRARNDRMSSPFNLLQLFGFGYTKSSTVYDVMILAATSLQGQHSARDVTRLGQMENQPCVCQDEDSAG
jgi:hypothetical protein